jgi:hypothetical protein
MGCEIDTCKAAMTRNLMKKSDQSLLFLSQKYLDHRLVPTLVVGRGALSHCAQLVTPNKMPELTAAIGQTDSLAASVSLITRVAL